LQQRHISDNQVNHRESYVLRKGELVTLPWQDVVVGDIIKMKNDQFVAVGAFL
jgi:phospholipid-translocating ATPase